MVPQPIGGYAMLRVAAVLVGLSLFGCHGDTDSGPGPIPPRRQVTVEPADLMTSVRGSPIRVIVGITDNYVPEAILGALRERLTLVTDEGAEVAIEIEDEPASAQTPQGRALQLLPETALASVWHEVRIDLRGLELDPFPALHTMEDGTFKTRFHPDSVAVVRQVRFCESKNAAEPSLAVVEFSEPVDYVADEAGVAGESPIRMLVDGTSCTLAQSVFDLDEKYNSHFEFSCAQSTGERADLRVEWTRDLLTASGQKVSLLNGAEGAREVDLKFSDSYSLVDCKGWHLP